MTDTELLAAIRAIVHARPSRGKSAEVRDLEKYDRIAGLLKRHSTAPTRPAPAPRTGLDDDPRLRLDEDQRTTNP